MSRIGSLVAHPSRVRLASCAFVALATGLSLAPMAIQAITSPASAAETQRAADRIDRTKQTIEAALNNLNSLKK